MARPPQQALRDRVDSFVLDPARDGLGHAALAALVGCTPTFVRLRRNHHFPERSWGGASRPEAIAPVAVPPKPRPVAPPPVPARVDHAPAGLFPALPAEDAAGRCRRYLREFREVRRRHRRTDWRVPAPVPAPEPKEFAHAS